MSLLNDNEALDSSTAPMLAKRQQDGDGDDKTSSSSSNTGKNSNKSKASSSSSWRKCWTSMLILPFLFQESHRAVHIIRHYFLSTVPHYIHSSKARTRRPLFCSSTSKNKIDYGAGMNNDDASTSSSTWNNSKYEFSTILNDEAAAHQHFLADTVLMNGDGTVLVIVADMPPSPDGLIESLFDTGGYNDFYGAVYIFGLTNCTSSTSNDVGTAGDGNALHGNGNGNRQQQQQQQQWIQMGTIKGTEQNPISSQVDMSRDGTRITVGGRRSDCIWIFDREDSSPGRSAAVASFKLSNNGLPIKVVDGSIGSANIQISGDGNTILAAIRRNAYHLAATARSEVKLYSQKIDDGEESVDSLVVPWVEADTIPSSVGKLMLDCSTASLSHDGRCMVVKEKSTKRWGDSRNESDSAGLFVFELHHMPNEHSTIWHHTRLQGETTTAEMLGTPSVMFDKLSSLYCNEITVADRRDENENKIRTQFHNGSIDESLRPTTADTRDRTSSTTTISGSSTHQGATAEMEIERAQLPLSMKDYDVNDMSSSSDGNIVALVKRFHRNATVECIDIIVRRKTTTTAHTSNAASHPAWVHLQTIAIGACNFMKLQLSYDGNVLVVGGCNRVTIYNRRQRLL